ncbi:uncharacterized protein ZBAI_03540 [Zygosaccharomyces bailii ISA1307]|nr:uncharacterized protein ZBAI_03540 [Zygosaccharomyces bailii ISA1307]
MDDFMLTDTENRDEEAHGEPRDSLATDPTIADPTTVAEALSKTRRTQVKLTADRLLSDKGLPHLVRHGPKRLRISTSRNTPYENLSQIVRFYQLWAHELYPKAKFRDFVKITRGLKNDRALKEYRTNLCLNEMAPNTHESPQDQGPNEEHASVHEAVNHVEQDDEDIYTDSLIKAQAEGQEEMFDTQLEEDFDEDHDALEVMKDMGF